MSRKLGKARPRATHRRTDSSYDEHFWLLGAAGVAMRLPVPIGTPLF